jgi:hypothetical protein
LTSSFPDLQYFPNQELILVNNTEIIGVAKEEFHSILKEELEGAVVLIV